MTRKSAYDCFRICDESDVADAVSAANVESPDRDVLQVFGIVSSSFNARVKLGSAVHVVAASIAANVPRQHSTDFHDAVAPLPAWQIFHRF